MLQQVNAELLGTEAEVKRQADTLAEREALQSTDRRRRRGQQSGQRTTGIFSESPSA
jgi:hypothetical protein